MEEDVAAAVGGVMAEIFAPVGAVSDPGLRPQYRAYVPCQVAQLPDKRERIVLVPQGRQPAQFGADQEGVDTAGDRRQSGEMQHETAIAPVVRLAVKSDRVCLRREIPWLRRAAEAIDLRPRGSRLVG